MGQIDSRIHDQQLELVKSENSIGLGQYEVVYATLSKVNLMRHITPQLDHLNDFSKTFQHKNLLRTYGYQNDHSNLTIFEMFDTPLAVCLQQRANQNRFYNESDLFEIFESVYNPIQYLDNLQPELVINHGDIESWNIFYNYEKQIYQIYDHELIGGQSAGFKATQRGEKRSFLAPEQLKKLTNNSVKFVQKQCDLFAMGLVLLECARLVPSQNYYNWDKFTIDFVKIQKDIDALKYSDKFKDLLRHLLSEEPGVRSTWNQEKTTVQQEQLNVEKPTRVSSSLRQNTPNKQTSTQSQQKTSHLSYQTQLNGFNPYPIRSYVNRSPLRTSSPIQNSRILSSSRIISNPYGSLYASKQVNAPRPFQAQHLENSDNLKSSYVIERTKAKELDQRLNDLDKRLMETLKRSQNVTSYN